MSLYTDHFLSYFGQIAINNHAGSTPPERLFEEFINGGVELLVAGVPQGDGLGAFANPHSASPAGGGRYFENVFGVDEWRARRDKRGRKPSRPRSDRGPLRLRRRRWTALRREDPHRLLSRALAMITDSLMNLGLWGNPAKKMPGLAKSVGRSLTWASRKNVPGSGSLSSRSNPWNRRGPMPALSTTRSGSPRKSVRRCGR